MKKPDIKLPMVYFNFATIAPDLSGAVCIARVEGADTWMVALSGATADAKVVYELRQGAKGKPSEWKRVPLPSKPPVRRKSVRKAKQP